MPYEDLIRQTADRYGIPYDLLYAQVAAESSFNPTAVSREGAQGLLQLMPATAAWLGVTNPFDPAQNLDAGAHYLRQQYDRFGSWDLALAAYNWGPNRAGLTTGAWPDETRRYVSRILSEVSGGQSPPFRRASSPKAGEARPQPPGKPPRKERLGD